ncbi:MAG: ATP-binding cassette domain-containing protein [Methanoculleaceae archaeon]
MKAGVLIEGLKHGLLSIDRLEIGHGTTAVIGPNGSGKTTLLRLIAGLETPSAGSISAPDGIGYVCEYPDRNALFSRVYDEIASPLRFQRISCGEIRRRVEGIAADLGINLLLSRRLQTISTGERVLVAVATAIISRPQLLLLDEYDSHLDPETSRHVMDVIGGYLPPMIVFTTQRMWSAARADRVIFLEDGKVLADGRPAEVFASLRDIRPAFVPPFMGWAG